MHFCQNLALSLCFNEVNHCIRTKVVFLVLSQQPQKWYWPSHLICLYLFSYHLVLCLYNSEMEREPKHCRVPKFPACYPPSVLCAGLQLGLSIHSMLGRSQAWISGDGICRTTWMSPNKEGLAHVTAPRERR